MSKKLIKVPYIDQTKEWPTGCESVSAVMLLQYLGMDANSQYIAIGVVIFVAISLDIRKYIAKK